MESQFLAMQRGPENSAQTAASILQSIALATNSDSRIKGIVGAYMGMLTGIPYWALLVSWVALQPTAAHAQIGLIWRQFRRRFGYSSSITMPSNTAAH